MFGKISLRNVPHDILAGLGFLADQHDRSTEAEARQALRAWVEPVLMKAEQNNRNKEVAQRLNRLLEQLNAGHHGDPLRPSHLAQAIGLDRAGPVSDWFAGLLEPSFSDLSKLAEAYGVQAQWLQHGDRCMYPVGSHRLQEDPFAAVRWLTTWDPDTQGVSTQRVGRVHLVRSKSQEGELVIVKESEKGHFRIFGTPTHVSESIGSGGEAMLMYLFLTLELLCKRYTRGAEKPDVRAYLLSKEEMTVLRNGNTNPVVVLTAGNQSTWWEDIWDASMRGKGNYWPGWQALFERIERAIASSHHAAELRMKIRSGKNVVADALESPCLQRKLPVGTSNPRSTAMLTASAE